MRARKVITYVDKTEVEYLMTVKHVVDIYFLNHESYTQAKNLGFDPKKYREKNPDSEVYFFTGYLSDKHEKI